MVFSSYYCYLLALMRGCVLAVNSVILNHIRFQQHIAAFECIVKIKRYFVMWDMVGRHHKKV